MFIIKYIDVHCFGKENEPRKHDGNCCSSSTSIMVLMAMIMPSFKISVLKSSPPSIATFGYVYLNKR